MGRQEPTMPTRAELVLLLLCLATTRASRCNGKATPGPPNVNAILTDAPRFVADVKNGKHFQVGPVDGPLDVVHVYGNSYDMGFAYGTLLRDRMIQFFPQVRQYLIDQVTSSNNTFMRWISEVG